MKLKKAAALALAFATATAICVPATALAADPTAGSPAEVTAAGGSQQSVITGTIKPTTLKVSVPTVVSFDVDPGATPAIVAPTVDNGYATGQFKSPSNITVTNYSVVDVHAYISGVTSTNCSLAFNENDVKAGVRAADGTTWTTPPGVQFALRDVTDYLSWMIDGPWLNSTTTKVYPFNLDGHGKLAASADGTAAGGAATMYTFGKVAQTGWKAGDSFTITPTFTIATSDPGNA